jgi:hypothetical protein
VLDLLAEGSVTLTTIRLLGPHLTKENHRALLAEASGKGKSDVKKIVARIAPQADVPASIRKLPTRVVVIVGAKPQQSAEPVTTVGTISAALSAAPPAQASTEPPLAIGASVPPRPESHRPIVEALSPARYRLQLTVDQQAHDDLRDLQDLMRREIPDGDAAAIVARALHLLREEAVKKAFAATAKPRPSTEPKAGSRNISAAVQRAVWTRDGGRCGFTAATGRRCDERSYLEYHHARPYAWGGEATVDNIQLRCRAHNAYEAELLFGLYEPQACQTRN